MNNLKLKPLFLKTLVGLGLVVWVATPLTTLLSCGTASPTSEATPADTNKPEPTPPDTNNPAPTSETQASTSGLKELMAEFNAGAITPPATGELEASPEYQAFASWVEKVPILEKADRADFITRLLALPLTLLQKQQAFVRHFAKFMDLPLPAYTISSQALEANKKALAPWVSQFKTLEAKIDSDKVARLDAVASKLAFQLFVLDFSFYVVKNSPDFDAALINLVVEKIATLPLTMAERETCLWLTLTQLAPTGPKGSVPTPEQVAKEEARLTELLTQYRDATTRSEVIESSRNTLGKMIFTNKECQDFLDWARSVWAQERTNATLFINKIASFRSDQFKNYLVALYADNADKPEFAWFGVNPIRS